MSRYDLIVVGAGPAGAGAALVAARGGARVALVDRAAFPRDKPCGDLLGRAAVRQCALLGLDLASLGVFRVRGVTFRTPTGRVVSGVALRGSRALDEAAMITRYRFDAALVEAAVGAGARLVQGQATSLLREGNGAISGVSIRAGGLLTGENTPAALGGGGGRGARAPDALEFRAPLVIGADGWGSGIARQLLGAERTRPAQRGVAIRCYVAGVRGLHGRMRFFGEPDLVPGCAWIFPLGGDRANVGLGTLIPAGAAAPRLGQRLDQLIRDPGSPAALYLSTAQPIGPAASWPLALGWRDAPLAFDGALLAGDAASLISPMSGSGIAAALLSGRLAGEMALAAVATGDVSRRALQPYEHAVRRSLRARYRMEFVGQRFVSAPARLDALGLLAKHAPYAQAVAGSLLFNLG